METDDLKARRIATAAHIYLMDRVNRCFGFTANQRCDCPECNLSAAVEDFFDGKDLPTPIEDTMDHWRNQVNRLEQQVAILKKK